MVTSPSLFCFIMFLASEVPHLFYSFSYKVLKVYTVTVLHNLCSETVFQR